MQDSPVKICFIAPKADRLFYPEVDGVFGGAEIDLYMLATELALDKKFEVSFIVADHGQPNQKMVSGVKVIKSLDLGQNALKGAYRVWKALRQTDSHIYLMKTMSSGVPLVAYFCKRHHKVFCYRTAHAHECDGTFIAQFPWLGKAFIWALRQAKAVFSQNKDDARNLLSTTGISAQTIPNGHKMPTSQPVNKDVILWVGRSVDFKKPQLFLDLARQHPQNEFVMICQEATGEKGYDDLIAQAGMLKNLQFIERVGFNEIDDYFLRAKVLVNTSDAEGFPNTFIQACKAATPILSLNVNPDGFLDKYNCGLCCHGDTEKMATELETIISTQAGTDMGTNAREYVEQTHDISKIVDRYKEIFRTIKCR